jgi:hypothetical protein
MSSPICTVNLSSVTDGADVTAGATVSIELANTAGVTNWQLSCVNTDEYSVTTIASGSSGVVLPASTINVIDTSGFNATGSFVIKQTGEVITYTGKTSTTFTGCTGGSSTLTTGTIVTSVNLIINSVAKTASFVAPAAGSCLIFQSKINNGRDINNQITSAYTTTFEVNVPAASGARVMAYNEKNEGSAAFGWIKKQNFLIRNFTGSLSSAGAGMTYGSGAYDVVSADSSIVVNADNIQFRTAFTTLLNGATSAATTSTLCQRDFQGAINLSGPNGGAKYEGSITVTPSSTFNLIQSTQGSDIATNNLTIQSQNAFASATGSNRKPGDLNLVISTPSNSGTTDGFVNVKVAGTTQLSLGRNNTSTNALINFPGSGEITTSVGGGLFLNTTTIRYGISGNTTIIQPVNNTTNGATGDQTIFSAMACTGTTSTGGALSLRSGNGTTVAGDVTIINGASTNTTFSSTGVTFSMQTVQFVANQTNCIIKQADNTTNSATAATLTVRAANATGTTSTGGDLIVASGTGTTANGNVKINSGSTTRIQANGTGLGFFAATPVAKPTVTGAKGGNAALASLLTQLVSLGLITDSSTA